MTTTTAKKLSFLEFLARCPDDGIFELVDGGIVEVDSTRAHKNVARFLMFTFNDEIRRKGLDCIVDKDIVVRTIKANGQEQGRKLDVAVVSATLWNSNVLTYGAVTEPPQLAVEVVSPNWEDDYVDKLYEYQRLGISEYWIVDYLALASRSLLGNPKLPTVFVYHLVDGKYQVSSFKQSEKIISPTFPKLELTVEQILSASQMRTI